VSVTLSATAMNLEKRKQNRGSSFPETTCVSGPVHVCVKSLGGEGIFLLAQHYQGSSRRDNLRLPHGTKEGSPVGLPFPCASRALNHKVDIAVKMHSQTNT